MTKMIGNFWVPEKIGHAGHFVGFTDPPVTVRAKRPANWGGGRAVVWRLSATELDEAPRSGQGRPVQRLGRGPRWGRRRADDPRMAAAEPRGRGETCHARQGLVCDASCTPGIGMRHAPDAVLRGGSKMEIRGGGICTSKASLRTSWW